MKVVMAYPSGGLEIFAERAAGGMPRSADVRVVEMRFSGMGMLQGYREGRALRHAAGRRGTAVVNFSPWHWGRGGWRRTAVRAVLLRIARGWGDFTVIAHDTWPERPTCRWERWLWRWFSATSRRVVALSQWEKEALGRRVESTRLIHVPHYVEDRSVTARVSKPPGTPLRLVAMGFVHPRKRPERALEVLAALPDGSTLTFVGALLGGPEGYEAGFWHQVERLGLRDRVQVTGYVDDREVDRFLSQSDVGLAMYRAASTSGSLLTLLAGGRPIVAARIPALCELEQELPEIVATVEGEDTLAAARAVVAAAAAQWDQVTEKKRSEYLRRRSISAFGRDLADALGVSS